MSFNYSFDLRLHQLICTRIFGTRTRTHAHGRRKRSVYIGQLNLCVLFAVTNLEWLREGSFNAQIQPMMDNFVTDSGITYFKNDPIKFETHTKSTALASLTKMKKKSMKMEFSSLKNAPHCMCSDIFSEWHAKECEGKKQKMNESISKRCNIPTNRKPMKWFSSFSTKIMTNETSGQLSCNNLTTPQNEHYILFSSSERRIY